MQKATIVYCFREGEILLGMKKERFGKGKWNGFGGKLGPGEAVNDAAIRELEEEAGLKTKAEDIEQVALVSFFFGKRPIFECHVFFARGFEGELIESAEMSPEWFPIDRIPYSKMWPSDLFWLPAVLAGERIEGSCWFDESGATVERVQLRRASF